MAVCLSVSFTSTVTRSSGFFNNIYRVLRLGRAPAPGLDLREAEGSLTLEITAEVPLCLEKAWLVFRSSGSLPDKLCVGPGG